MTFYVYDAAYAPNLDQVKAHGGIAMTVYLTSTYAVNRAWVDQVHAKGLGVIANYEQMPAELVTAGRFGGQAAGKRALIAMQNLGFPPGCKCYFSVDTAVPMAEFPQIGVAFDGVNEILSGHYATDVYGEGALIDYLIQTKRVRAPGWLSGSSSFPGYDPNSPNVVLVQHVGSPVPGTDQDEVHGDPRQLGAWWPAGSPYEGAADMPLTDADAAVIWGHKLGTDVGTAAQALHDARTIAATARDNAADAETKVAALTTQVAALTAKVAALTGGVPAAGAAPVYEGAITLTPKTGA